MRRRREAPATAAELTENLSQGSRWGPCRSCTSRWRRRPVWVPWDPGRSGASATLASFWVWKNKGRTLPHAERLRECVKRQENSNLLVLLADAAAAARLSQLAWWPPPATRHLCRPGGQGRAGKIRVITAHLVGVQVIFAREYLEEVKIGPKQVGARPRLQLVPHGSLVSE